jgi:hypothetical protein
VIILKALRYDIDRCLKWGALPCAAVAAVLVGWMFYLLIASPSSGDVPSELGVKRKSQAAYLYPLDAIGTGPLALRPKIACGWVSRIAEEFSVFAFNSRPDVLQKDAKILIGTKEGKESAVLQNGKAIFLQERTEGKGLEISDLPTSIWIKPILLDNGSVLIEAGRKLISRDGEVLGEEKGEFIAPLHKNASFRQQESLSDLRAALHLGEDPLIEKYGGAEYASWKEKIKLHITSGSKSYAVFVSKGDFLQFKNQEWRIASGDALSPDLPLACIVSSCSKAVEIQAWDASGFFSIECTVTPKILEGRSVLHELYPTALRLRSNTQVSCLLGKKRMLLKKGDWLLKTASGWRNLRRADEIEDCLFHRLKGELFIFDGIEKQQGKTFLAGYIFDALRTQAHAISLPIDTEKKGNKKDKHI